MKKIIDSYILKVIYFVVDLNVWHLYSILNAHNSFAELQIMFTGPVMNGKNIQRREEEFKIKGMYQEQKIMIDNFRCNKSFNCQLIFGK